MKHKLFLLCAMSLAAAVWPFAEAAEEIKPVELAILVAAAAAVLAVQCAALGVARRFVTETQLDILIALLVAANAYHFAFLAIDAKTWLRLSLAAMMGAGAWLALRNRVAAARVAQFALAFTLVLIGQYAYGAAHLADAERLAIAASASLPVKSQRNVYLISTESLHSPHAFRRFYGIEDAPHVAYLTGEGFRVLERTYSPDIATRHSYQRILEFGKPLKDKREQRQVFWSGNSSFSSFRNSGYKLQFIYISNYMNLNPQLVDHAFPQVGFYVCDNLPDNFFYFACKEGARNAVSAVLYGVDGRVSVAEEIAHLKERVKAAADDAAPWLTISHIAFPNHTPNNFLFSDTEQAERFRDLVRGQMPQIAANFRDIVGAIKAHDPDAIVILFGDHGMQLTRGMPAAAASQQFSAEDIIEDRYGAMLAVYPGDFCRKRIFDGSSTSFVVESVIQCLNGDDEPTPADIEKGRSIFFRGAMTTVDRAMAGK